MSKTFIYLIVLFAVYLLINGVTLVNKNNSENGTKTDTSTKTNDVETGAKGQLKYRFGYTN